MTDKKKRFCYEHPRPAVSVDMVIFVGSGDELEVLLIKRKGAPFKGMWAIPGGFVEMKETLAQAAARELEEETGLKRIRMRQFGAFGDPDRDPRGRTISIAFVGKLPRKKEIAGGDDAAEAAWHPVRKLPKLGFDHRTIIREALKALS
jgi:8-oxo-dGTP diphosphatase